jgi:hypothetical protein
MITHAIFWAFWAMVTAGVMLVDRALTRDEFSAPISTYFVLAAITPFMVLPVYFYSSHRSDGTANRWGLTAAGLPLTALCWALAFPQFVLVMKIVRLAVA